MESFDSLFPFSGDEITVEEKQEIADRPDIPDRPYPCGFQTLKYDECSEGNGRDQAESEETVNNIFWENMRGFLFQ